MKVTMSSLAETIYKNKYSIDRKEEWADTAHRVTYSVVAPYMSSEICRAIENMIASMKFMPGGRYLYAAGRKYPQVNNCYLLSVEDNRESWGTLMNRCTQSLMTGGGIGVVYSKLRHEGASISGLGGKSTGPCALMQMVNECGRHIMQGGSRRSAIWAGLHWSHKDIFKFIHLKNWCETTRLGKSLDFNYPAPMDGTNISVILDDHFFEAYHDPGHRDHSLSQQVYNESIRGMLTTGEPGFSIDIGENEGEHLRNAPVSGATKVLIKKGEEEFFIPVWDIIDKRVTIWTGKQWASNVVFIKTREMSPTIKVSMSNGRYIVCSPDHEFITNLGRRVPASNLEVGYNLMSSLPEGKALGIFVTSIEIDKDQDVYCCDVGVEEHSFCAEGVIISNCTEVVSRDNCDMCNLGSINMSRIESLEEMKEVVELSTIFLLCGTLYSKLPLEEMYRVREKNRRLGLGLMGIHEWLLKHNCRYEPSEKLSPFLQEYNRSGAYANRYADKLSISRPVATRAVAPTGTISIVAETTSGIEPVYAVALKRRYLDGKTWKAQYIIDPTAKRLIDEGIPEHNIEDAVSLSYDVNRRIEFQSWLQQYVDHGISSTINLPQWGSESNNESTIESFSRNMMTQLPKLRGVTAYPDGARDGQPLVKVPYREAIESLGVEIEDGSNCKGGVCGV